MSRITVKEQVRMAASLLGKRKRGVIERKSAEKTRTGRINARIATAERLGRHDEANAIRWLYYPEKMRKREIEAQLGKAPKA